MASIKFLEQPSHTHRMQYACDFRKDKCLSGKTEPYAIIEVNDERGRSGVIKCVAVTHESVKKGKINDGYYLHPNLLKNNRDISTHFNELGVGQFTFLNHNGKAFVNLENICIRRCKKEDINGIKLKSNKNKKLQFDPFKLGFNKNRNYDLQRIRLCCQAYFDDSSTSNIIVSDIICNGANDIKIERWDDNVKLNTIGGDRLFVFIRKLTHDQKDVYAIVSDDENWKSDQIKPIYEAHGSGFVFEIPPYKQVDVVQPVRCKIQLFSKNEIYCSDCKYFTYMKIKRWNKRKIDDLNLSDETLLGSQNKKVCSQNDANNIDLLNEFPFDMLNTVNLIDTSDTICSGSMSVKNGNLIAADGFEWPLQNWSEGLSSQAISTYNQSIEEERVEKPSSNDVNGNAGGINYITTKKIEIEIKVNTNEILNTIPNECTSVRISYGMNIVQENIIDILENLAKDLRRQQGNL